MKKFAQIFGLLSLGFTSVSSFAHYPFVAPLSYQTFNHYTSIISGFYDNPFASEVAIKNFKFHVHKPDGTMLHLVESDWISSKTLSSYSLENKEDGTYRIRAQKDGTSTRFALDSKTWKVVVNAEPKTNQVVNDKVIYAKNLKKNATLKTVQNIDVLEAFVSKNTISNKVIHHINSGFDVQFLTHPNAFKVNQVIQLKMLDDQQEIANLKVEILAQTHDFSRNEKVFKTLMTDANGGLNFNIAEKGQYLLRVDYQQPFTHKSAELKRYKYTLAFNVID